MWQNFGYTSFFSIFLTKKCFFSLILIPVTSAKEVGGGEESSKTTFGHVERQKVVASIQKIDDYLTSEDSDLVNNRDKKI